MNATQIRQNSSRDSIIFAHDFVCSIVAYYGNSDQHLLKGGHEEFLQCHYDQIFDILFYIFVLPRYRVKIQSLTNITTLVFWTFISENLAPPLNSTCSNSFFDIWSKWRHILKNTARIEIIIPISTAIRTKKNQTFGPCIRGKLMAAKKICALYFVID